VGDLLAEKARRKVATIFPPGSDPPNGLGLDADEINDALASLRDFAREEKRRR
jgi:hypothetical protein